MVLATHTTRWGKDHLGKDDRHCRDVPLVLQREGTHTTTHLAQGRRTQHTRVVQVLDHVGKHPWMSA